MRITVFDKTKDEVINSIVAIAKADYRFAVNSLYPLITKLEIQRRVQENKFYDRLKNDIINGCIMPPLTLAIVVGELPLTLQEVSDVSQFINKKIADIFILDGIQRLNTLQRASESFSSEKQWTQSIYFNVLICSSIDHVLYRMITLNNGQKPMTPRHQIEILTNNIYDFDNTELPINTEKQGKRNIKGGFDKADFVKAYLAFLSNSIDIDNQKIIQEKLDQILADKIIQENIPAKNISFSSVIGLIERFITSPRALKWFKNPNYLIGFCVGINTNYEELNNESAESFESVIEKYENSFNDLNLVTRFRVGNYQRIFAQYIAAHYQNVKEMPDYELTTKLANLID